MLRVVVRGSGVRAVVLGSGEKLLVGRAPQTALPEDDPDAQLRTTAMELPRCAPHVSRVVGEVTIADELVRLRHQAVLRLDIPVPHALVVGERECVGHHRADRDDVGHRQRPVLAQPVVYRAPV